MQVLKTKTQVPVHTLEQDGSTANKHFKVYHFEGDLPHRDDLLIPHRKNHYLLVFIREANTSHWIDMVPYTVKNNHVYFSGPDNVIVKDGYNPLWSTGIAFTSEFLSLQGNGFMEKLPIIQNIYNAHELTLNKSDVQFVSDMFEKIRLEWEKPGEWQQAMLTAYLTVLLTYLSRVYNEQYDSANPPTSETTADKALLRRFQSIIEDNFNELHEVSDYASRLHISAGHLSEVVKVQSGKPAIKHIHERLILEARRLLFHTNNSLKEIAFELGFSDASYFNRFFKRETGATPAGYRSEIRKMYH